MEVIGKGKLAKPWEFGVKVALAVTNKESFVLGCRSMPGNPYDGHTLAETLEQAEILSGVAAKRYYWTTSSRVLDLGEAPAHRLQ